MTETTTVEVKNETWKRLNNRRDPGDSMDDVIANALDASQDSETAHAAHD